jgi:hypothetical protein
MRTAVPTFSAIRRLKSPGARSPYGPAIGKPLRSLPGLARALNIGQVFYKDEGGRFGLGIALLFGTEGATDPDVYRQIVGRSADDARATAVA